MTLILGALVSLASPQPQQQIYTSALTAMSNLPQPQYIAYSLEGQSDGLQVDPVIRHGNVWLDIHGGSTNAHWTLEHQTDDYNSVITNQANGERYFTARSFFDPTWYGALRALHEGMFDSQDTAAPHPSARLTPPSSLDVKTIAIVAAIGPAIYNTEDRGEATCSNGDPGLAMHLVSRTRDSAHQLTDVIVDTRNMRFCMLRFAVNSGFGFHGTLEQHYGDVGGYWMQTDGVLDGTMRVAFIAAHHGVWRYQLTDVTFPPSLPAQDFTAP